MAIKFSNAPTHIWIEGELNALGVSGRAATDLLVIGLLHCTLRVADARGYNARHSLEMKLGPPEAAAGKRGHLVPAVARPGRHCACEGPSACIARQGVHFEPVKFLMTILKCQ
jgi:hypothetical protein